MIEKFNLTNNINAHHTQEDMPKDAYTNLKERLQAKKDGPAPKEVVEGQMYNDKVKIPLYSSVHILFLYELQIYLCRCYFLTLLLSGLLIYLLCLICAIYANLSSVFSSP